MNLFFGCIVKNSLLNPGTILEAMFHAGMQEKKNEFQTSINKNIGIGFQKICDSQFTRLIENESYLIAVDGRIDNQELRDLTGDKSLEGNLADILVNLCDASNVKASGEFVILIINKREFTASIVSDHIGTRPLFYSETPEAFVFSTDISAIQAVPFIDLRSDDQWIADSLSGIKSETFRTPYDSIFKLDQGSILVYDDGIILKKYWQPDILEVHHELNELEAIEQFRSLLSFAIDERIDIQNPNGIELSGGLDSSSVSAILVNLVRKQAGGVFAFSHILPDDVLNKVFPYSDERAFSQEVVKHLQIEKQFVSKGNQGGIVDLLKRSVHIHSGAGQGAYYMLSDDLYQQAKAEGIRTLFSGFGGDEGVTARKGGLFQEIVLSRDWEAYRRFCLGHGNSMLKDYLKYFVLRYTPINNKWLFAKKERSESYVRRLSQLALSDYIQQNYNMLNRYRKMKSFQYPVSMNDLMYHRLLSPALSNRLQSSSVAAKNHTINYTYPLLDRELIEFYFKIPWKYKVSMQYDRLMIRNTVKEFLPESIRLRKDKTGTTIPSFQYQIMNDHDRISCLIQDSKKMNRFHYLDYDRMLIWQKSIEKRTSPREEHVNPVVFLNSLQILMLQEMERNGEFKSGIRC